MLDYLQRSWRPSLALWGLLGAIWAHLGRSDRSPVQVQGEGYRRGRRGWIRGYPNHSRPQGLVGFQPPPLGPSNPPFGTLL
eukprot:1528711-Pyramimonas_sp.AAC.1